METADALGSSTAPLTWHDFLERMRQPSASDFVKAIKSFIVSFSNNAPDPEKDSAAVQQFFTNMEAAFRAHPLWAGCSEEELESASEGLEKYVMTKLFTRVFASLPDDVKLDEKLYEKMALVQQFIRPENLDIKPTFQNESSWLLAQKELQKINLYKAPRDKLVCILNCCKVINNILLRASLATNENPPGADEFLPVLIYVTIKANPPQLHSNLLFIQRYRHQSRLVSEAAYFFTNMLSAASFILNIDANSLSMDESEFEKSMESARALLSGLSGHSDCPSNQNDQKEQVPRVESMEFMQQSFNTRDQGIDHLFSQSPELRSKSAEAYAKDHSGIEKALSISDMENKGANMLLKDDQADQVYRDYPYLYANVGDLTISDVEDLLNNYKQLVLKYVCLSKGMGIADPPLPSSTSATQTHVEATKEIKANLVVETSEKKQEEKQDSVGSTDESSSRSSFVEAENSEHKVQEDVVSQTTGENDDNFQ